MEKELNLNIASLNGNVLTILHGNAPKEILPNVIEFEGDIKTVANFLSVRKNSGTGVQAIDKSRAVVFVNKKAMTITLNVDPEFEYGATVSGKLEESDELKTFGINTSKIFTKDALVQLIKFSKLFFDDPAKHDELLKALQKASSSVSINANDSKDERGNKQREFLKTVTTNIPTEFLLTIPIFKGFSNYTFRVDICLDVKEGNLELWLESTQLHEIKMMEVDKIFAEQLAAAEGFVIINQ